jgi:septal ring factor EnvC (AmiA/AmiB activator)
VGVAGDEDRERRLEAIRSEIGRLRQEMDGLGSRERTLLGEVERLGAEIRLREAELAEASLRLEEVTEAIGEQDRKIVELSEAQTERRAYLAFRLRELYKRGPVSGLRRLVGGEGLTSYLPGVRYAAYLSERDGRVLREFRADAEQLEKEREKLETQRERLAAARADGERARVALTRSRDQRRRAIERIQGDRRQRQVALDELESASRELSRLVVELGEESTPPSIDIRKFRGLLDPPARGAVSAGFGNVVHPRFKTMVPHPGMDIEAASGEGFHSVFDGRVLFASWLHGYGLTVIVDHGEGVASVYAHGNVLLVEPGEGVVRGQQLGKVGETGSLRGPYLYFEIRDRGKPVDPAGWLRKGGTGE